VQLLVLVSGVDDGPYSTFAEQLRDAARVLEDPGIAARLKEVNFGQHSGGYAGLVEERRGIVARRAPATE
jgi:hypothetical protein